MKHVVLGALLAACTAPAYSPIGTARFANRPIAWRVDDRADVAKKPAARPFAQKIYFFDAYVYDPVTNALELEQPRHALDVNALDEVPDSSWFENRIGVRELTPADISRGPNEIVADARSWTIIQSKTVGGSAGFIALDGRGDRYVMKLDEPHAPVTESATDVAVQRLMWAIGYHVPENSVVYVHKEQLHLGNNAIVKDEFDNERPMKEADIDATLSRGYLKSDGTYRMLASKYLAGKPLGGWSQAGTRPDDPNDRFPHEHMRVVRGLYLFFAWLQQTDVKEDNTLDMWVEDKSGERRTRSNAEGDAKSIDKATKHHYVKHHLVDFGKSLGMSAWIVPRPGDGHQQNIDYGYLLRGIVSFGLWVRPYEGTLTPGIQGVGTFDAEHYDPATWQPHANYTPLDFLDDRDLFWAAKILVRFTPAQIRAALEQGRYEDPRAVDYLTEVLVQRQRITARWVLMKTAAIDKFTLTPKGLCFDDLLVTYNLQSGTRAITAYDASAYSFAGQRLPWSESATLDPEGHTCLTTVPTGPDHDGYAVVLISTRRAEKRLNSVEVHVATDPATHALRIIGVHRLLDR
ncbi:MAG: hypothetical protein ABI867_44555 [Kofleriaceae bacterium]